VCGELVVIDVVFGVFELFDGCGIFVVFELL